MLKALKEINRVILTIKTDERAWLRGDVTKSPEDIWCYKASYRGRKWPPGAPCGLNPAQWKIWLQWKICFYFLTTVLPQFLKPRLIYILWLRGNACQCRRLEFNPWVRKILWRRKWQPTPVFLLGESPWTGEPGGLQSMGFQKTGTRLRD